MLWYSAFFQLSITKLSCQPLVIRVSMPLPCVHRSRLPYRASSMSPVTYVPRGAWTDFCNHAHGSILPPLYSIKQSGVFFFQSQMLAKIKHPRSPARTYKLAVSRIFATRRRGQFHGFDIAVQNTGKQRYASVSTSGSCRNSPLRPRTFVVGELASVLLMDGGRK